MKHITNLKKEDGSTLIETLVAMAILVSVLLPTSMFLGYVASGSQNEGKILALGIAQSEMERLLNQQEFSDQQRKIQEKWVITNTIKRDKNLVQIKVLVSRVNKSAPIITLTTERLSYEEDLSKQ